MCVCLMWRPDLLTALAFSSMTDAEDIMSHGVTMNTKAAVVRYIYIIYGVYTVYIQYIIYVYIYITYLSPVAVLTMFSRQSNVQSSC